MKQIIREILLETWVVLRNVTLVASLVLLSAVAVFILVIISGGFQLAP